MIPSGLHDNIIYRTGIFVKSFQDKLLDDFRKAGYTVTTEQFNILTQLWYRDGQSQQQIAEVVGRDKTTVSRVLDSMIKRDLIKKISGSDKRERLIYLTRQGQSIQQHLVGISGNLYMKAIQGVTEKDLLRTIKTLTKMSNNLHCL